jgi:hypothetical protein
MSAEQKLREIIREKIGLLSERKGFKNTKDFGDFLEEIDGMGEGAIRKIMGKDYIDTPGYYQDEKSDYGDDVIEFMLSNMGREEYDKLEKYWNDNVAESVNLTINENSNESFVKDVSNAKKGDMATGGGHPPFIKVSGDEWINAKTRASLNNAELIMLMGGFKDSIVEGKLQDKVEESVNLTINEKIELLNINEGQFSWMTQDDGEQIGSEKQNTITVYMHDNEGNSWEEKSYEGYGVFGGLDYYSLLSRMNGYGDDRDDGIDIAFGKKKSKVGKKTLFPALTSGKKLKSNHDFTKEPESDPDQSWYQEKEYDEDDY